MWFLSLIFAVVAALLCLRFYAKRGERKYVLFVVGVSWSIGFFLFLVLPFDLEHAYCKRCLKRNQLDPSVCTCLPYPGIDALPTLIPHAYRTTMLLGYVMNDLLRSYIGSGEFTQRGRVKDTLKEFAAFYVPFGLVSIVFLIYLLSSQGLTLTAVRMMVTGLFNAIGLFILVAFLGYGLVEVPRRLWNRGDTAGQLRYLKFKVAVQSEELHEARRRLDEVLESVSATDAALRAQASSATNMGFVKLQAHMAQILKRCPAHGGRAEGGGIPPVLEMGSGPSADALREGNGHAGTGAAAIHSVISFRAPEVSNHRALISLHVRLKAALAKEAAACGVYEYYVREGIRQQELLSDVPTTPYGTGLPRAGAAMDSAEALARRRRRLVASFCLRAGAICCFLLSILVVWCEGTIMLSGPPFNTDASPLSWVLYGWGGGGGISRGGGGWAPLLLLYITTLYCAWCTFFSMFNNCAAAPHSPLARLHQPQRPAPPPVPSATPNPLCAQAPQRSRHPPSFPPMLRAGVYPLLKNRNTSANNLLFNATYACRLGPPLCFNLLKLIHEEDAADRQGGPRTFFMQTSFGAMDKMDVVEIGAPTRPLRRAKSTADVERMVTLAGIQAA